MADHKNACVRGFSSFFFLKKAQQSCGRVRCRAVSELDVPVTVHRPFRRGDRHVFDSVPSEPCRDLFRAAGQPQEDVAPVVVAFRNRHAHDVGKRNADGFSGRILFP